MFEVNKNSKKIIIFDKEEVNTIYKMIVKLTPEATWVFIGQAGTAVAGIIGIKLLTNVLVPSEFGKLALANTIIALIGTNLLGSFGQAFMRFWSIGRDSGNLDVFYTLSYRLIKYICIIIFLIAFLLFPVIFRVLGYDWAFLVVLSLIIGVITGASGSRMSIFSAARQRKRTAILNINNQMWRPVFATVLVILTFKKANIALLGYLLSACLIFLITEWLFSRMVAETSPAYVKLEKAPHLFNGIGKEILIFSAFFIIWGFLSWIMASCDRWALQTFYGSEIVGSYAVVSFLATYPLLFGSNFLTTLLNPIAFQRAGNLCNGYKLYSASKIINLMILIYVGGSALLIGLFIAFHNSILLLISNEDYARFSYLLPWLTAILVFYHLGEMLVSFGVLANRLQIFFLPKTISSLIAGIFIFHFSAKFGPIGVLLGFALGAIVYTPWCMIRTNKLLNFLNENHNLKGIDKY